VDSGPKQLKIILHFVQTFYDLDSLPLYFELDD